MNLAARPLPLAALTLAAATLLVGCGDDDTDPVEQLEAGLEQVEAAQEKIQENLTVRTDAVERAQEQLENTARKLVNLYRTRADALATQLTDLPAAQEADFSRRLDAVRSDVSQLELALQAYAEQGTAATQDTWNQVTTLLDTVAQKFDDFEAELADAGS